MYWGNEEFGPSAEDGVPETYPTSPTDSRDGPRERWKESGNEVPVDESYWKRLVGGIFSC